VTRSSAEGLKNIPINKYDHDLTFVVEDSRVSCPRFIADFVSPRVGHFHAIDSTVAEFRISICDSKSQFSRFLLLGFGDEIDVDDSMKDFGCLLWAELGKVEVYRLLNCDEARSWNVVNLLSFF